MTAEPSMPFLLGAMTVVAAIALACGMLIGAMLYTTTCTVHATVERRQYTGAELHCPVPPWLALPRPS